MKLFLMYMKNKASTIIQLLSLCIVFFIVFWLYNVPLEPIVFGIVQQDVFLFSDSIAENIRYGRLDASMDEIIQASKLAEIYDDICAMPDGFDTNVGERGTRLSGGQKQRISIARIFLKNPAILILDEATSALDSVTEAKIQKTFEKLSKGRTTIIIAHRLSTVKNADRISVIDNGTIIELGSHDELMRKNGSYANLIHSQELKD